MVSCSKAAEPYWVNPHFEYASNLSYPMPWQGPNSGASHDVANLCQAVCRLHELIREHVGEIRRAFHSKIHFRSRDIAPSFYICRQSDMALRNVRPACQGMGYSCSVR